VNNSSPRWPAEMSLAKAKAFWWDGSPLTPHTLSVCCTPPERLCRPSRGRAGCRLPR
jgi:ANTAR domain.